VNYELENTEVKGVKEGKYMRRMLPMVWSSRSTVKEAALTIFVSLSYETLIPLQWIKA
jgi:hypothetical protein